MFPAFLLKLFFCSDQDRWNTRHIFWRTALRTHTRHWPWWCHGSRERTIPRRVFETAKLRDGCLATTTSAARKTPVIMTKYAKKCLSLWRNAEKMPVIVTKYVKQNTCDSDEIRKGKHVIMTKYAKQNACDCDEIHKTKMPVIVTKYVKQNACDCDELRKATGYHMNERLPSPQCFETILLRWGQPPQNAPSVTWPQQLLSYDVSIFASRQRSVFLSPPSWRRIRRRPSFAGPPPPSRRLRFRRSFSQTLSKRRSGGFPRSAVYVSWIQTKNAGRLSWGEQGNASPIRRVSSLARRTTPLAAIRFVKVYIASALNFWSILPLDWNFWSLLRIFGRAWKCGKWIISAYLANHIFVLFVSYDCICDMDQESVIKTIIYYLTFVLALRLYAALPIGLGISYEK